MRAGYPLDTLGWPKLPRKQSPARRDGAWKVGGSNYESFSGFNLTWLMAFVGLRRFALHGLQNWQRD
jgi:hypothetical protein